jgi:hypothetical protein
MLDQAIVGSALTGALGLLGAAISKCKCFVRCLQEGEDVCSPSFGCGFTDSKLMPDDSRLEKYELNENDLLVIKKTK